MSEPFTPEHVRTALHAFNPDLKLLHFEESTATSQQAADAIGCALGQIAKSLCFLIDGEPVLVVASGDQKVDDRKLAARYAVGRKKVKTAKPEQCIEIYGYAPGGVPPVALRTPDIPVYIDQTLLRFDVVYAAAGAPNVNFGISMDELIKITGGEVIDCVRDDG